MAKSFPHHQDTGVDPAAVSFIDGAVLNNRPFQLAISAIHGRPAYRQVDRRLVYIEPHPAPPAMLTRPRPPGFFATVRGAMSDIPASQPVPERIDGGISEDELRGWREQVNDQVAIDAGFAYQAYVRLKLASVRAFGAELIVKLRGVPAHSPMSRAVAEIIDAWALHKGIVYERADSEALEFETQTAGSLPA